MKNKGLLFWGELLPMRSSYDLNQNKIKFSLNSSKSRPTWPTSSRLVYVLSSVGIQQTAWLLLQIQKAM